MLSSVLEKKLKVLMVRLPSLTEMEKMLEGKVVMELLKLLAIG